MKEAENVYQRKIDDEGEILLNNARNEWAKGQNRAAADKAGAYLVQINPQSKAYQEGMKLHSQIERRIQEIDQQAWEFQMKKYQDSIDYKQSRLNAIKEVAIAVAQSRKRSYSLISIHKWWGKK